MPSRFNSALRCWSLAIASLRPSFLVGYSRPLAAALYRPPVYRSLLLAFLVAPRCEQGIEQPLSVIKARRLEPGEGLGEIDHSAPGREIEHAERAGYSKTFLAGDCHPFPIVHQHEVRPNRDGERDCRLLAIVQSRHCAIAAVAIRIWARFQPTRSLSDPRSNKGRRI